MALGPRLVSCLVVLGPEPEALREALAREALRGGRQGDGAGDHAAGEPTSPPLPLVPFERFPAGDDGEVPLTPMLASLPEFCFQEGARLEREAPKGRFPAFLCFALTTQSGIRVHAACLVLMERQWVSEGCPVYAPKILCLFSLLPCLGVFRHLLHDLAVAARCDIAKGTVAKPSAAAQRFAAQLFFEVPLPPDHTTQVAFSLGGRSTGLLDQTFARDVSFRPLFACLSTKAIAKVFVSLLLERKVVLTSKVKHPALVSAACEVLLALLFPFQWEHLYIPVLPLQMRWALDCPTPFLVGAPGGLGDVPLPDDVAIFDLDDDSVRVLPPDAVPREVAKPLERLRDIRVWEQREANQRYWARFHLERFPASGRLARPTEESAHKTSARLSKSSSPEWWELSDGRSGSNLLLPEVLGSEMEEVGGESGSESTDDGSNNSQSEGESPWSEDQEQNFRQQVGATFLEIFVRLLHNYPNFLDDVTQTRTGSITTTSTQIDQGSLQMIQGVRQQNQKQQHAPREGRGAFLQGFFNTNAWERFLELSPDNPRVQLFRQAIDLYNAWSQEPDGSRRPFHEDLRGWAARIYEPVCTVVAPARGGSHSRLVTRRARRQLASFEPLGTFGLSNLAEQVLAPFQACPSPSQHRKDWQMPPDAVRLFITAVAPALSGLAGGVRKNIFSPSRKSLAVALLPRVLRHLATLVTPRPWGADRNVSADLAAEETAVAPLPAGGDLSAEALLQMHPVAEGGRGGADAGHAPRLVLRTSCVLQGVRDVLDPCPECGWRACFWETLRCAIRGFPCQEGRCTVECHCCGRHWAPRFALSRSAAGVNEKDKHSSPTTHMFSIEACLARIAAVPELREGAVRNLAEQFPQVFWCLHVFFGLRVEIFARRWASPPGRLGCATFETLCRAYLVQRRRLPEGAVQAGGALAHGDATPSLAWASSPVPDTPALAKLSPVTLGGSPMPTTLQGLGGTSSVRGNSSPLSGFEINMALPSSVRGTPSPATLDSSSTPDTFSMTSGSSATPQAKTVTPRSMAGGAHRPVTMDAANPTATVPQSLNTRRTSLSFETGVSMQPSVSTRTFVGVVASSNSVLRMGSRSVFEEAASADIVVPSLDVDGGTVSELGVAASRPSTDLWARFCLALFLSAVSNTVVGTATATRTVPPSQGFGAASVGGKAAAASATVVNTASLDTPVPASSDALPRASPLVQAASAAPAPTIVHVSVEVNPPNSQWVPRWNPRPVPPSRGRPARPRARRTAPGRTPQQQLVEQLWERCGCGRGTSAGAALPAPPGRAISRVPSPHFPNAFQASSPRLSQRTRASSGLERSGDHGESAEMRGFSPGVDSVVSRGPLNSRTSAAQGSDASLSSRARSASPPRVCRPPVCVPAVVAKGISRDEEGGGYACNFWRQQAEQRRRGLSGPCFPSRLASSLSARGGPQPSGKKWEEQALQREIDDLTARLERLQSSRAGSPSRAAPQACDRAPEPTDAAASWRGRDGWSGGQAWAPLPRPGPPAPPWRIRRPSCRNLASVEGWSPATQARSCLASALPSPLPPSRWSQARQAACLGGLG